MPVSATSSRAQSPSRNSDKVIVAAIRRIFDGIIHQIAQHLAQFVIVAFDR